MKIALKILGIPQPKQSTRFKIQNFGSKQFAKAYQPDKVVQNERNIAFDVKSQLPNGFVPMTGAIHVKRLLYVFPPLSSFSKKKLKEIEEGKIFYKTTKPDLTDNLNKPLFDALQGIVYLNDSQVCKFSEVDKIYGTVPRIEIEFEEL
ncbi:Holliday junction resolvase [Chryseobacterium nakagawai]|uniref:RusA family crossover junction endodeoxyribonuclease n=1 Tax=Chryseobacterium nakagawai TaxID=1241982 RepID=A0AAD1DQA6_CHRNA|nr:RusA family crossover junction endodeoxyribonuclease [Chryseobacterium nakagawai]AZA91172.1 RusA family crossover junction endodeoxyribonuclease [Chryseobacterium nakagawai]VEH22735.1 Holliday junction resolvase [Chryseobacterium nakagawai]